jgi:6-phosphogluconolactonase
VAKPDGKLIFLNQEPMPGGPCHAMVDVTGKNVLIANYGNGTVANMRVETDGSLQSAGWIEKHPPGADAGQVPHAHFISPDPANRFVLSNDAGDDKVWVYHFDAIAGKLTPNDPPYASLPPHAAPRHLVFSPNGKFVYTIQEAASTVTAFTYDPEHGVLHDFQSISTLPAGFTGKDLTTAELVMHPSGKFLYGSNRGHDSIVTYSIDEKTGKLTLVGHTPSGGKIPRGLAIDPTGQWLLAGNQNSDNIVEFHVDPRTGSPMPMGVSIELGAPVCFQFVQLAK